jgi:hypothetical protein
MCLLTTHCIVKEMEKICVIYVCMDVWMCAHVYVCRCICMLTPHLTKEARCVSVYVLKMYVHVDYSFNREE